LCTAQFDSNFENAKLVAPVIENDGDF
jgi:hypothetical protein